jgi:hypothetical protein
MEFQYLEYLLVVNYIFDVTDHSTFYIYRAWHMSLSVLGAQTLNSLIDFSIKSILVFQVYSANTKNLRYVSFCFLSPSLFAVFKKL